MLLRDQECTSKCNTAGTPKPNAPINVMTDASDDAIGVIIKQYLDGKWCPFHTSPTSCPLLSKGTVHLTASSWLSTVLLDIFDTSWKPTSFMCLPIARHSPTVWSQNQITTHRDKYSIWTLSSTATYILPTATSILPKSPCQCASTHSSVTHISFFSGLEWMQMFINGPVPVSSVKELRFTSTTLNLQYAWCKIWPYAYWSRWTVTKIPVPIKTCPHGPNLTAKISAFDKFWSSVVLSLFVQANCCNWLYNYQLTWYHVN